MKGKKGFNAKAFLVNHAEKLGFGLIALTVTGIWASEFFGGSWSRERRSPQALIQEIEKKKAEIDSPTNLWPADKQAAFKPVDFSERATTLLRPINSAKYELSTELFVPLNRPKEKAREAEYLAVESLMAVPGHVILAVLSQEEMQANEAALEAAPEADSNTEEDEEAGETTRRDMAAAGAANPNGEGSGLAGLDDPTTRRPGGPPPSKKSKILPGALPSGGAALVGQADAIKIDRGKRTRRGLDGQSPAGRSYVAVRGVWPINRQLERIQRALHLPTKSAAMDYLDLMDFDLERQVATKGDDPWSKDWEKLDIKRSLDILKEVDGFDDEPLDMEVFDPVITMPLPMRAFGVWTDAATHPRIKNYELTPEGKEREKLMMSKLLELQEKMAADLAKTRKGPEKKGFNSQSHDFRGAAIKMQKANSREMMSEMKGLSQELQGAMPNGAMGLSPEKLSAKVTAVGQLLLFRYFDFDVRPGFAYRYRVKLKLRNPNFEREVTEVVDPSVADGELRETPYSNISNPAILPVTPKYFLHSIEKHPLVEDGRKSRTIASINMFEWHKELGTNVSSMLELTSLGQFVGGKKEVEVLDVTTPEIFDQEYPFTSEDMVLDGRGDPELIPDQHPDLKLETNKTNKPVNLGLAAELIVVDGGGELRVVEAGRDAQEERSLRAKLKTERKAFEGLKKKEEGTSNALDGMPKGLGMAMPGSAPSSGANAKGKGAAPMTGASPASGMPNPRRKGGNNGAGAAGMVPAMNMPGGGYSMPPANGKKK